MEEGQRLYIELWEEDCLIDCLDDLDNDQLLRVAKQYGLVKQGTSFIIRPNVLKQLKRLFGKDPNPFI